MQVVADLEVHSKYARAVSSSMNLPTISSWAEKKGIGLVGTGDFTHPMWLRELEANLEEAGEGIFKLKRGKEKTKFLLTSEVSCIYSDKGKGRRVHVMVYLSSFSAVKSFNEGLTRLGANLFSDGRPIVGLSLYQVAQVALLADAAAIIIPAHVWTPWFGFYGNMSGYDSLKEAFKDLAEHIPAVETGLSSDPAMNWRIAELTGRQIVSFGDAHSPQKLGREATVFELGKLSFSSLKKALEGKGEDKIAHTIEFYPEEGKYHFTGHRKCSVTYSPGETKKMGGICPVCGKALTLGVMGRVEQLAEAKVEVETQLDANGLRWTKDKEAKRPPYTMLVPLAEVLSETLGVGVNTKGVGEAYERLLSLESEFGILMRTKVEEIEKVGGERVAEAISKVRKGDISIKPGYDGVFGEVKIWKGGEGAKDAVEPIDQGSLF